MPRIDLLFGNPTTEEQWEIIENFSYSRNISIESAIIQSFQDLTRKLIKRDTDKENYFELILIILTGSVMRLQRISVGIYKHRGFVYPSISIHGHLLTDTLTNKQEFITDKMIEFIGCEFEDEFKFEFCGYKRIGKITANKEDVIYDLGGKSHIYHSGNFLKVKIPKKISNK